MGPGQKVNDQTEAGGGGCISNLHSKISFSSNIADIFIFISVSCVLILNGF